MSTTVDRTTYSSVEACEAAGLTYRMLDHWCRTGTIVSAVAATGSGSRRRWTRQQVAVLAVLAHIGRYVQTGGDLEQFVAVLLNWDVDTWDSASRLLVAHDGGVWVGGEPGAPAVTIAVDLGAIAAELALRRVA